VLPIRPGLTPHGLRHGHQTWLDDLACGTCSNVTPGMREELRAGLEHFWKVSLMERVRLAERSAVPVLDHILMA
jgi:hypothetical protein